MRDGSVTHAFDMDQRMVGLSFTKNSGSLTVTGPPNGNTAPPGYYMLFLMNSSGVPSVAKFIQVSKTPTDTAPKGTITSPASNVTIAPGQSVSFAGTATGSISAYSWVFRGASPAASSLANPGNVTFANAGIYTAVFTVTDAAGQTDPSPATRTITVTSSPAPKLTSVSPTAAAQGKSGLSVALTGSNFLTNPACSFGNDITVTSCTYNSSTSITAVINVLANAALGSRNVMVTNTDGQSATLSSGFNIVAGTNPAPSITNIVPNSGTPGQSNLTVTVTGANFLANPLCASDNTSGITFSSCTQTSSTKITAVLSIASNAVLGSHNFTVTNADGQAATLVNGFTVTSSTGGSISFGSGFTAGSMVLNGNSAIANNKLTVTPNAQTQAGTAWFPSAVNIQSFTTDFTFQQTAGTNTADGMAFVIQNNNTAALGASGGSLGYKGITNSLAVKFDLYSNAGEGNDSTGLYTGGVDPSSPAVDMTGTVNLHLGDVMKVHMTYDGTNLAMTITDSVTAATFSKTWAINIPTTVGGNTAYVGFSGGTGGYTALQQVLTWTMTSGGSTGTVATPQFSLAGGTYLGTQTVMLSDSTSGASIFYTLDGTQPGTSVGGSTMKYSSAITVSSTETIKALATASGQTTSGTVSATYTIESQVAMPTFSPAGGSYSSTQTVMISSGTSGATIYYTTNGSTPSHSSSVYSGAITVSASETIEAIAAKSGYFDSNVGTAIYTIGGGSGGGSISFGSGFAAGSLVTNGNSSIASSKLTVTPNAQTQAGSAWYPTAVNIQNFTTDFTFQQTAGANTADGMAFVIQGNNTAALGATGGSLGYKGIANSLAVKFDLYSNAGEGNDSTGLYTGGVDPSTPAVDMTGTVDLHTGDVMKVHMTYDGTNLAMTLTDSTTSATFSKTWAINIPSTVGGNTAYVGFTGGTGGYTALQQVLTWTMSSGGVTGTVATPTFSPAGGSYTGTQTVMISTATSGATIYYTTNGNNPTTGSTLYSGAISVASTETVKALAVKSGMNNSAVGSATYTIGAAPTINYATGFTTTNLALIGNAGLDGTRLLLTDTNTTYEVADVWYKTAVNVQKFTTDFQFQLNPANADGFTFIIQNAGLTAAGGAGGNLGYAVDSGTGVTKSIAVKFDLYDNSGEGDNSTGLYTNGAVPGVPATTLTGGVDLHSGDIFAAHFVYNGTTLTMTLTDTANTADTYTQSWTVNIPSTVGANTAYVGFGAGTGGYTAQQEILNWTYSVN